MYVIHLGGEEVQSKWDRLAWKEDMVQGNTKLARWSGQMGLKNLNRCLNSKKDISNIDLVNMATMEAIRSEQTMLISTSTPDRTIRIF